MSEKKLLNWIERLMNTNTIHTVDNVCKDMQVTYKDIAGLMEWPKCKSCGADLTPDEFLYSKSVKCEYCSRIEACDEEIRYLAG